MLGRNVGEFATWAGVKELCSGLCRKNPIGHSKKHFDRGLFIARLHVFESDKKMLYNGTYVWDDDGTLLLAIYTMREATDLNDARKKIEELEQPTHFYDDQLRTLKT